ncbi:MAG: glycoprotease, partial [Oscillospiraceae bacterium]
MITLGIDTSNYASSIAVIDFTNKTVLLNKKKFLTVATGERGLRQQDAVFNHIKNLTEILELVGSEIDFNCIQAVGVSIKPTEEENSYMPCFLVGRMAATAIAASLQVPLITASHQLGHLNSALFYLNNPNYYCEQVIMFHVSGGTTDMLLVSHGKVAKKIGTSMDLFAGQAIDRLGVKLGYSFPAGEYVSKLAKACTEELSKTPKISIKG